MCCAVTMHNTIIGLVAAQSFDRFEMQRLYMHEGGYTL